MKEWRIETQIPLLSWIEFGNILRSDKRQVETICIRASPRVKRSSILLNNGLSGTEGLVESVEI